MNIFSNTTLLCDVDDTILNFEGAFSKWFVAEGYQLHRPLATVHKLSQASNTTDEEAEDIFRRFYHTREFANLEPLPHAKEMMTEMYIEGFRFIAITAVFNDPAIRRIREENLRRAFGFDFEDCICVGLRMPKTEALKRFDPSVWVEDNWSHAVDGAEIGHNSFLIDRQSTREFEHPLVKRVPDWRDIYEAITHERVLDAV